MKNTKPFSSKPATRQFFVFAHNIETCCFSQCDTTWKKTVHFTRVSILITSTTRSWPSLSSHCDPWVTPCFIQVWIKSTYLCWGCRDDGYRNADPPSTQRLSDSVTAPRCHIRVHLAFFLFCLFFSFCFFLPLWRLSELLYFLPICGFSFLLLLLLLQLSSTSDVLYLSTGFMLKR